MEVDSVHSAVFKPVTKLKRKRSSEQLRLRHVEKQKVFLQDSRYSSGNQQKWWSSNVHYVSVNISVSLFKLIDKSTTDCI